MQKHRIGFDIFFAGWNRGNFTASLTGFECLADSMHRASLFAPAINGFRSWCAGEDFD
jgi:hypothetical protein